MQPAISKIKPRHSLGRSFHPSVPSVSPLESIVSRHDMSCPTMNLLLPLSHTQAAAAAFESPEDRRDDSKKTTKKRSPRERSRKGSHLLFDESPKGNLIFVILVFVLLFRFPFFPPALLTPLLSFRPLAILCCLATHHSLLFLLPVMYPFALSSLLDSTRLDSTLLYSTLLHSPSPPQERK